VDVGGKPHVWFTVEPVGWLGSREQAPLRLLLSADMNRERASRLIENAQEIVFSNPVKGAYHMTREDIAWVSKWANLTYASELSADTPAQETIEASGKTFACERMKMLASTVTDPPVVPKQTIEFKGTVWRSEATPFGVVRAEWLEKTTKKDRNREETRRLTLQASGWETPPAEPVDRGKDFSVWRLIFGR
jgi:predicted outer membrane lipoprotein